MRTSKYFLAVLLACVLAAGLFAGSVHAFAPSTWVVGPDGDDANNCTAPETACKTVNGAITKAAAGDTIQVLEGTYSLNTTADSILLNKDGISLVGAGVDKTIFETSFLPSGFALNVSANGVSISDITLHKTDKAGEQNIIYVSGDDFTFANNLVYGDYVLGDGEVSRAFVVTGGVSNFTVTGNTFHNLRQPGYLNGSLASPTTGTISNNLVYNTRGWVIAGANMDFTGNTWTYEDAVNAYDVAIIAGTPSEYYQNLVQVSEANNDASIEDQRVPPSVLTVVHVDAAATAGGAGGPSAPYQTINAAFPRVMDGGKILVSAGNYLESVTVNKPGVRLLGAGYETTSIIGNKDSGGLNTLTFASNNATVAGFTITRDGNTVADWGTNVKNQGVLFNQGVTGNTLRDSMITGNRNGVYLNNTQGNIVRNNIIDFNRTGIQLVNNVDNTLITENQISNNWTLGILFNLDDATLYTSQFAIENNTIKGNWYCGVESRWANSLTDNVSGNWLGSASPVISNQAAGEPGYAIQIPVKFGGDAAAPATAPDLCGVHVDKIDYTPLLNSGTDTDTAATGFQGDFSLLFVVPASPQSGTDGRIQEAVKMAADDGTINVPEGTYVEQVKITHPVTVTGAGVDKTIVQAPANLVTERHTFTFGAWDVKYVIGAFDADGVTVQDLSVDGNRVSTCAAGIRTGAVAMIDSSMTLTNAHIYDISPNEGVGCQAGAWQGILAAGDSGNGADHVKISSVTIERFQKNAITARADAPGGLMVDIEGNTITSEPTPLTAQNGIQITDGAAGVVKNNHVTGIFYTGSVNNTATGMLVYNSYNLEISGNQVAGAQTAIYVMNSPVTVLNNVVTSALPEGYTGGAYWGITVTDPPSVKPSPTEGDQVRSNLRASRHMAADALNIVVKDNVVNGAADHEGSVGIEADAGYDVSDSNVRIERNRISGWGIGFAATECDPAQYTCSGSVFTGLAVHFNQFDDNLVGFQNDSSFKASAENNWWGCNAGPGDAEKLCDTVAGTGEVVYDPWLVLTLSSDVQHILPGTPATLVADLTTNSNREDTSALNTVQDGLLVTFTTEKGQLSSSTVPLTSGKAQVTLSAGQREALSGTQVTAQYDDQVVSQDLTIGQAWMLMPLFYRP